MDAKARFNELRGELRLPLDDLARLLGRGHGTMRAYASPASRLQPPQEVLEAMEAELVGQAIDRIRKTGFDVIRRKAA
ncbi:hypothetical protein [Aquibium microcysteis]|uniref:hypothetical protein n=1 Tax=Aquibium microcysteis TaxID=675281 RepID=UPI00165D2ECF|nr:hypothetical protein [Aquibium microcysteis]